MAATCNDPVNQCRFPILLFRSYASTRFAPKRLGLLVEGYMFSCSLLNYCLFSAPLIKSPCFLEFDMHIFTLFVIC